MTAMDKQSAPVPVAPERTDETPSRRRTWGSLQVQLPLLISALLLACVVVLASWSYSAARRALLISADAQLGSAVGELANGMALSAKDLDERLRSAAAEPAVVDALRAPSEQAREKVRGTLAEFAEYRRKPMVAELWTADGEKVLTISNERAERAPAPLLEAMLAPTRPGFSTFRSIGDATVYDVAAAVRGASDVPGAPAEASAPLGYLTVRLQITTTSEGADLLRNLFGQEAEILLGNEDGRTWTNLEHPVPGPSVGPLSDDALVHAGADGVRRLGHGSAIGGTPWVLWVEQDVDPVLAPARNLLARMGGVCLVLLVLGGGISWWIGRQAAVPIRRVTEAAEDLARGRRHARLDTGGPDEVSRLAASFNLMAASVESRSRELERVRDEYEALYDACPDMYLSLADDGRIVRCNETAVRRLGFERERIVGRSWAELCGAECAEAATALQRAVLDRGRVENAKLTVLDHRGRGVPVLASASVAREVGGKAAQASISLRDVSDVTRAEARRAAVLHDAMDAIVTIDAAGRVVEYNPAAAEMFGYATDEVRGRLLSELIIPERLRAAHEHGLERLRATGRGPILGRRIEVDARRKDGSEFPAELTVVKLEGTETLLFTGFLRDLTALKAARRDLERTIVELRRSNQDLEQFAYVASHDLQEPLRMVTLFMEMLADEYSGKLDPDAERYITYAVEGATRLRRLVDGLLTYSRVGTRGGSFEVCASGDVLEAVLQNLALLIAETGVTIEIGDLPTVFADPIHLEQVFFNLVSNALKFRADHGPRIAVRALRDGAQWEFRIEDNGVGFDPAQKERIFQMFQRLNERRRYEGNGIGLAVSKRIVERHGGRIWATSSPGRGSCFFFTMPAGPPEKFVEPFSATQAATNGVHP